MHVSHVAFLAIKDTTDMRPDSRQSIPFDSLVSKWAQSVQPENDIVRSPVSSAAFKLPGPAWIWPFYAPHCDHASILRWIRESKFGSNRRCQLQLHLKHTKMHVLVTQATISGYVYGGWHAHLDIPVVGDMPTIYTPDTHGCQAWNMCIVTHVHMGMQHVPMLHSQCEAIQITCVSRSGRDGCAHRHAMWVTAPYQMWEWNWNHPLYTVKSGGGQGWSRPGASVYNISPSWTLNSCVWVLHRNVQNLFSAMKFVKLNQSQ